MAATCRAGDEERGRGFTLVELLIAMVILSILAAVAIPAYTSNVRKGRQVDAQRVLMSLAQAEEMYRFQNGVYTNNVNPNLTNLGFVDDSSKNSAGNQYYPQANITIVPGNPATTYVATIKGNIGGAVQDQWTIDQTGALTNTVQGY
jgi:type IV pilus assembly protein PilE